METGFYYVYALKDPRSAPPKPFYIGKGTGSRAFDHLAATAGTTRKTERVREINATGGQPLVEILVDNISEALALRLEAELIAAFGTEDTGGLLTNVVVPKGVTEERKRAIAPHGAVDRAQLGLGLLREAVLSLVQANPTGVTNADVAGCLGLRSDHGGKQKDYLSYSILGLLLREGRIRRDRKRGPYMLA